MKEVTFVRWLSIVTGGSVSRNATTELNACNMQTVAIFAEWLLPTRAEPFDENRPGANATYRAR